MLEKIIIAGAGGQGVMLLGRILSEAAMREDKFVTLLPAYGAEVRGGTSYCMVNISDEEIGSPYIDKADTLIIMNGPSLAKFKKRIKDKGLAIINSSLATGFKNKNIDIELHPFTDKAIRIGNIKVANMIALGCYINKKHILNKDTVVKVLLDIAPEEKKTLVEINRIALDEGFRLK
ncbi:MAG: 2-oxoacid:acceptor oxidoreductase family protein [Candidatus Omnitrophica bacterium]|nr:2-oxoacid:acceptor oxidoreductase family protein [Candidatus Omnitrophota bacterium]